MTNLEKTAADQTPQPVENAPFSMEDWLLDANLPTVSVDLYKNGSIPGEAKALQRQIEIERGMDVEEKTAVDKSRLKKLEKQYTEVLKRWADSRITVYVSALSATTFRELRAENETEHEGKDTAVVNELYGYSILSRAIVGIAEAGATYTHEDGTPAPYGPVSLPMNQIRGMERKLGPVQMGRLLQARQEAQTLLPEVDADFLRRSSGDTEGNTQD